MVQEKFELMTGKHDRCSWIKTSVIVLLAVFLGFTAGILIGRFAIYFGATSKHDGGAKASQEIQDFDISDAILSNINNTNIETYLRLLTEQPHVAGSARDHYLANYIHQFWSEVGLEDVTLAPYDVLLSLPDPHKPSLVRLLDDRNQVIYESQPNEDVLDPLLNQSDTLPPYNAYSANGIVEGELVYVNYASFDDYQWLERNNVNISGKIVIARYGKIFRGSKVELAAERGALGVILYSDPADYIFGQNPPLYPHTWWLPPSGVQRGTIFVGSGDPLTPSYPSIRTAYRYNETDPEAHMPKIPCYPINYGLAEKLLSTLGGVQAPLAWHGKLNVTYNLGPGFLNTTGWKVQMKISSKNQRTLSYNVFGFIRGALEPDRYVLFGNHRDAWVFGATDPSGGTAIMMEVARAMGSLVKSGQWQPRRSILFCSWGAEEFGLLGSTEFVEHYIKNLQNRAVAYINVDIAVQGNYSLYATGNPLLKNAVFDAAKKVPSPLPADHDLGLKTVYSAWARKFPQPAYSGSYLHIPRFEGLGSNSDYGSMIQLAGVTAVDITYMFDKVSKRSLTSYPLYHSAYDTFENVKNHMDPNFETHRSIARVTAELTRSIADSLILPLNVTDYANSLKSIVHHLIVVHGTQLNSILGGTWVNDIYESTKNFTDAASLFEKRISMIDQTSPLAVRMVNDQLMLLEKAFLDPNGLPLRHLKKHILFAENMEDHYASSTFPGLEDLLFSLEQHPDSKTLELIKHHFSVIRFTIASAASTLQDSTKFIVDYL